ncbi:MAG: MerR family transcriptional regulator [Lachnospiraceae bacterium]|nr:MerR family transcriptional regulator [Lachnospiraceae bacterium]
MDESLMKIGELAGFFGISVKALRIYEKMGILKPAFVDSQTGYRYYHPEQVQQLNALIELKQLGFSLAEIKNLLEGGMTNDAFMEALVHKKMAFQNAISAAENKIDAIDKITERLSSSEPATKMHELTEEERAWLLVKMVCVEDLHGQSVLSEAIWL